MKEWLGGRGGEVECSPGKQGFLAELKFWASPVFSVIQLPGQACDFSSWPSGG